MVSIGTMVQSWSWLVKLILLCFLGECLLATPGSVEHRSIRINQEDRGEIALFLLNVVITLIGKKLDKGYKCPVYCGVDHKHIYWEHNEAEKGHIPTIASLHRATRDTSKK